LHLSNLTLPKGVTAVTRGKIDPVIVSVVAQAEEKAEPGKAEPGKAGAAPAADAKK
jgi:large subunit ribosomal protein L25